jgi:hypothetical protein
MLFGNFVEFSIFRAKSVDQAGEKLKLKKNKGVGKKRFIEKCACENLQCSPKHKLEK